jgi:hypothetical protein
VFFAKLPRTILLRKDAKYAVISNEVRDLSRRKISRLRLEMPSRDALLSWRSV